MTDTSDILQDIFSLRAQMVAFVTERAGAIIQRYFPDLQWPRYFAGHVISSNEVADLAYLAAGLQSLGETQLAGHALSDVIAASVDQVDGATCQTFCSYRVAEALLPFGSFNQNAILKSFTAARRSNIVAAVDSTTIYDPASDKLHGMPNNFWAVLARCELGRQSLGILEDDSLLKHCIAKMRDLLDRNCLGFFDDSPTLKGRYDIYSPDSILFLEPLWPQLDPLAVDKALRSHVQLLETLAMENGSFIAWGRSVGALSLCLTMEMGAVGLSHQVTTHPGRMVALIANAFKQLQGWFTDDLISAHRGRMTFAYRGVHRLLQMSFDCLGKVCYAAKQLSKVIESKVITQTDARPFVLFPAVDEFVAFDHSKVGVWMFRNGSLAFQFPVVDGGEADYVPWFHSPGFLENPVDSLMVCGVPRIHSGGVDYISAGPPILIEKQPARLRLIYEGFRAALPNDTRVLKGRREVIYSIEGLTISAREKWVFEQIPQVVGMDIPEAYHPLLFDLQCQTSFHHDTVAIDGMPGARSFWGALRQLHQIRFQPARQIIFSYTLNAKQK